ncbi:MAG TPA: response regulator [Stenomitos sp.]
MNASPVIEHGSFGSSRSSSAVVLVIEDSDEDYEALERFFRKEATQIRLMRQPTGNSALIYLQECLQTEDRSRVSLPSLILLDLNLPGIDGRAVLRSIKQNPQLVQIPIVVLTTSNNPRDVLECYQLGANSYLVKELDVALFNASIKTLVEYWFNAILLP